MSYTCVDLFCAPGGFSLGFRMAGFEVVGAVDASTDGMETYRLNFPETKAIVEDLREVSTCDLKREFGIGKGEVDVVIGGPPCQGFSVVGRVKIASLTGQEACFVEDPRNELYKEFMRIVKELKPKVVVMENVPGMLSYQNGRIVEEIMRDFAGAGYRTEVRILNALYYGVPQVRRRVFFIATREDLTVRVRWPAPTHFKRNGTKMLFGLKPAVTVWEAIGDLPPPVSGESRLSDYPIDYDRPPLSEYQRWARNGSRKLHNHVARKHSERDTMVFGMMKEGQKWKDLPEEVRRMYTYRDEVFGDRFKKLKRNEPSWTIVAHLYKDGYMFIHPSQARTITVREAARLQSFPDIFIFRGSRTSQFKQVGNAVPPLLTKAVAQSVKLMLKTMKLPRV